MEACGRNRVNGASRRRGQPAWGAVAFMLVLMTGCAGNSVSSAGRVGGSVGVVDPQRILNETDAGKKALDTLGTFTKNRQALLELEEKELRRMEEDFMKQSSVLSANAKKEREEQFRRRMMEYQQKANQMNREIQDKQKEVLEAFRGRIERVVARIANKMGMAVVVEKGKGSPTVYADAALDISEKVIEEFNRGGQ